MVIDDRIKRLIEKAATGFPLPAVSGVYFLYDVEELVYVGKSANIHHRIGQHLIQKKKKFTHYKFIAIDDPIKVDSIERLFIEYFFPKYNTDLYTLKLKEIIRDREQKIEELLQLL